ncbi:MAG: UDP-3-O-acyl-N-acetylglucosamine deacetylase [Candidatus Omnitrophica bacterium]|nr:UDP-3-O-acyl-N-acetylglucosamine deacetylase [Candidatus Omnitrophota bacterium]
MDKQKTIASEISLSGIGLHTAGQVNLKFKPSGPGTGITFVRTDLEGLSGVKVVVESLIPQGRSPRRTSLGNGVAEVQTIEHLMAALAGLGIDNLIIEINNSEIPGLDGSSLNFVEALIKAGLKELDAPRQYFVIKEPIFVEEDGASITAVPADDFKISYMLSYNHPLLRAQYMEIAFTQENFKSEIAPARTFCLENEAEELLSHGVGCGANYSNTLVVGEKGVIKNRLRFDDEFVRHKILDLLGDLYVLGQPIKGHIVALKSGHSLNLKLLKRLDRERQKSVSAGIGAGYHPVPGEQMDINTIMKILPHREPFLFVDKIVSMEQGKRATGIKNVTINDYFFKGHFPGRPVMPGVLIVEAMAQVGGVMMLSPEENRGKLAFFLAADNIKFRKTVLPGDQLVLEVEAGKIKSKTGQVRGKAYVEGKLVCEADLMFALVES